MTYIIIVTYNAMPWIQKCLASCQEYPVVVVDNNSSDGTVVFIKENFPEVTLLPQQENLGFGQGNNLGIRYALEQGADYVFLLNQDAYLQEGCIEKLIAIQSRNKEYGILSPIHLDGKGERLDENFSNYAAYRYNPDFYSDFVLKKPLKEIYEVPFVNAAGWLLSGSILETVGGFDPIFFHYGEDDNYCQRAKFHGFKIGIVASAFLQHDREDRALPKVERGSVDFFKQMERSLKLEFGNINIENLEKLKNLIKKRKRNKLRALLKFQFSDIPYLNKELKLLTVLVSEIKKSREWNQQKKPNHLKLEESNNYRRFTL